MERLSETLMDAANVSRTFTQRALLIECAKKARELEWQADMHDMHEHFGHRTADVPGLPEDDDWWALRARLFDEEVLELRTAMRDRCMSSIVQESVDVIVVVLGTIVGMGVQLAPIWRAIFSANMKKRPAPDGGKWIKPKGWQKPDVRSLLVEQMPPKF